MIPDPFSLPTPEQLDEMHDAILKLEAQDFRREYPKHPDEAFDPKDKQP